MMRHDVSRDLYDLLGVSADAGEQEIAAALKAAAPHLSEDTVRSARETLLDPARRADYNVKRADQRVRLFLELMGFGASGRLGFG